ncbi:MAG: L-aspartate oxidase [Oscillatoriaceae cyanobacterium]
MNFSAKSESHPDLPESFDILVVGAGAAGLYAALCLPSSLQVGLITKDDLPKSASDWAQGGMAAAIAPDDSPLLHIEDTLNAGAGLCDLEAVEFLASKAKDCVNSLLELGVSFDRHQGDLALTLEAAHSRRRVLHARDTTGRAVVSTLTARILERQNIRILSRAFALDLWLNPHSQECQGVCLAYQGNILWVRAGAVVLATGGGGQVFAKTTNPKVSTGDGVAIAWRAGAALRDLEFVQFHPTALTKPGAPRFLISEAVRGEGAHLVNDIGHRFVFDYHPSGELAPRDVVSRAIFLHLQELRSEGTKADPELGCVWLDLRPIPPDKIRHRFPNIIEVCRQWGIDVFTEPVPVAPAAHYWMGGIVTDLNCSTSIPGLYAVGETASTGVHGANRLASNSLLECIVFAAGLAHIQATAGSSLPPSPLPPISPTPYQGEWSAELEKINTLRRDVRRLVWETAGICRSQPSLNRAISEIQAWRSEFSSLDVSKYILSCQPSAPVALSIPNADQEIRQWGETRNLLDVAYLILTSAAFREESRGGHYRSDFPEPEANWAVHTLVKHNSWTTSFILDSSSS